MVALHLLQSASGMPFAISFGALPPSGAQPSSDGLARPVISESENQTILEPKAVINEAEHRLWPQHAPRVSGRLSGDPGRKSPTGGAKSDSVGREARKWSCLQNPHISRRYRMRD
ncbi:MAG: hypothetical protein JWO67_6828 [Streptosporangiaceae bacterium]|nr:hypothetical protein [Streptosporangiaceae bacterium]